MSLGTLLVLALGVSADAFAVALGKGLQVRSSVVRSAFLLAVAFGLAQAIMPLLGWLLGSTFAELIAPIDHWVALVLLAGAGGKMVWEALRPGNVERQGNGPALSVREIMVLAAATSIDALAVGVSLAVVDIAIWVTVAVIGAVTFILSFAAVFIGHRVGARFRRPAEFVGGAILIGIGVQIFIEHLSAA